MTWKEFKQQVMLAITVDATRLNMESFIAQQIVLGVLDLQHHIPSYRTGHESIFTPAGLAVEGYASVGALPDLAEVKEMYMVKTGHTCCRQPINIQYPWEHRNDLVCGHPRVTGCQFFVSIEEYGTQFMVFPLVADGYQLEMWWDGIKNDYEDSDIVRFDERTTQAVAKWVKAQVAMEMDNDATAYATHMGTPNMPGNYVYMRRLLYLSRKSHTELAVQTASPQPNSTCAACACSTLEA